MAIPLNNGGLKGDSLEFGHLESDIPGCSGGVAAVVTTGSHGTAHYIRTRLT